MENVIIKNAQGEQININVIRYFKLNGLEYLVFSLNEIDEGGYVKLYISKISNNRASTITDDVEWNLIKDTIKTVIKSNKDNLPLHIIDLDTNKLADIQLFDQKVFKISDSFLQLLSANKKIETQIEKNTNFEVPFEETAKNVLETSNANDITQKESAFENQIEPQPEVSSIESPIAGVAEFTPMQDVDYQGSQTFESIVSNSELNNEELVENSDYALDYKTLYENEFNKNKILTEENQKYKNMIDNLKNIINETF